MATMLFIFSTCSTRATRTRGTRFYARYAHARDQANFDATRTPPPTCFPPMSRDALGEERQSSPKLERGSLIERRLTDTSHGSSTRPLTTADPSALVGRRKIWAGLHAVHCWELLSGR